MATKKQIQKKQTLIEQIKEKVATRIAEKQTLVLEVRIEDLMTRQLELEAEVKGTELVLAMKKEELASIEEEIKNL